MRDLEEAAAGGNVDAELAIKVFARRARKMVGGYAAVPGGLDAVVFTGGIGEKSVRMRKEICSGLQVLGALVDDRKNGRADRGERDIAGMDSRVRLLVVPTEKSSPSHATRCGCPQPRCSAEGTSSRTTDAVAFCSVGSCSPTRSCYHAFMVAAVLADDQLKLRPLKRAEYDSLVETGAFADERLELINGVIVEMSPQDARHAWAVQQLSALFHERLRGRASVRTQLPIALSDDSEPEPDVAVVAVGEYRKEHPATALLIVEVARSRLHFDRVTKSELYARAGIPEYWVVNLIEDRVEVHSKPAGSAYTQVTTYLAGERVRIGMFPDVDVPVADII